MEAEFFAQDDNHSGLVTATTKSCFDNVCNATVGLPRATTQPTDGTIESSFWCDHSALSTVFGLSDNGWFSQGAEFHKRLTVDSAAMMKFLPRSAVESTDVFAPD